MGKLKAAFLINDDVIVLEKGVHDESNLEVDCFRAAAVIRNNLEFDLEVALSYPEQSSLEFALVKSTTSSEVAEEIFENERFQPLIGWDRVRIRFLQSHPMVSVVSPPCCGTLPKDGNTL